MSVQIQYLRGSAAQLNAFTGAQAEIVVNTDDYTLRVMDGATPGGFTIVGANATQTLSNKTLASPVITGLLSATNANITGNARLGNIFCDNYYFANGVPFITNYGNANVTALLGSGTMATDYIPAGNATYSLGNSTNQWNDLWVSNATIYMNSVPISLNSGNLLTVNGSSLMPQNSNLDLTTTGTVFGNTIDGNTVNSDVLNVTGNAALGNLTTALVSTTNLTVSSNIVASSVNATSIIGTLSTAAQPNITSVGTLTALSVNGVLTATGNIQAGNIYGTLTQGVQVGITQVGVLANLAVTGNITTSANLNANTAVVTGNITSGNLTTTAVVASTANITGVATIGGNLTATGNVYGGNIYTNGAFWLGNAQPILTASGNLNVGAITSDSLNVGSGNITGGNLVATNGISWANGTPIINTDGNLDGNNITVTGFVTAGGNVTGQFIKGDGGYLTNVQVNYSNTSGTVTTAAQPNITSVGNLTTLNVTGSVSSAAFFGSGAGLSNINVANISGSIANATYSNTAGVAGTVTTNAQPNITSVGTLTSLAVTGGITSDSLSAATIGNTDAALIGGSVSATQIGNAGTIFTGTLDANSAIQPNITQVGTLSSLDVAAGVTALTFTGDGSALTNLTGANVTGTVANAAYSTQAGQSNFANTSGVAGTVTTAAQPNISSVGTLTSLAVTGNISTSSTGNINAGANVIVAGTIYGDGGGIGNIRGTIVTGTVANAAYSLQANQSQNANLALQADNANTAGTVTTAAQPNITSVGTLTSLTVSGDMTASTVGGTLTTAAQPNITSVGTLTSLDVTGAVTGASFTGDGSALTSLTGANVTGVVAQATQSQNANLALQANNANVSVVAGTVTTAAQPNITSVGTLTSLAVTGNITGGDGLTLTGNITSGNVQANDFFYANGIQVGNYANSNVRLLTNTGLAANVMPTVTNTYTLGNAAVAWQSINANVGTFTTANASQLNVANASFGTNGIYIAGNLMSSASNVITIDPASDGGTNGNLIVLGNVQVTGTLTYANATSALTDNLVWQAANNAATASLASGGGLAVGPAGNSYAAFLYNFASNVWQSSLPIQAANFIGDGSLLSSINGANVTGVVAQATQSQNANLALQANNANTAGTVTVGAQPNITSVGTLTSLAVTGAVTGASFAGDGGYLSNISGPNVVGFVANATLASTANVAYFVDGANVSGFVANATLASTANVASVAYSVAGANVTGTVALATVAGTVSTAAQPNITSVGTLTSLAVNGNINTVSSVNAAFFVGDGSGITNLNVGAIGTVANATNAVNSTYATNLAGGSALRVPFQTASGATSFIPAPVTGATFLEYDGTDLVWGSPTVTNLINDLAFSGNGLGASSPSTYDASAQINISYNTVGAAAANGINTTGTWTVNTSGYAGTVSGNAQPNITSVGNLVSLQVNAGVNAASFTGSGAFLTSVNGANVTGYVTNANNAIQAQQATIAGTAFRADYIVQNNQPNLTQFGSLANLTVIGNSQVSAINSSGNATLAAVISDNFYYSNGQPLFGSSGTLSAGNIVATGTSAVTGNSSAANFNTTGVANVGTVTTTGNATIGSGLTVTGTSTLTGTVTASTINAASLGNSGTTITGASVSAAQIGNAGTIFTGTIDAASNAQPNITSLGTLVSLGVTGAVTAATFTSNVATGTAPFTVASTTLVANLNANLLNGASNTSSNVADTIVSRDGSGNFSAGTITANVVNATTSMTAPFFYGQASTAQYADLAESYVGDHKYEPGTVVAFGGDKEVTQSTVDGDRRVAGVVSTNPAYLMNSDLHEPNTVAVALTGRVPTKVTGTVRKGDLMVSAGDGTARAEEDPKAGAIIGKALADFEGVTGVIEVVVGRF